MNVGTISMDVFGRVLMHEKSSTLNHQDTTVTSDRNLSIITKRGSGYPIVVAK